jgi:four helix bundle protein
MRRVLVVVMVIIVIIVIIVIFGLIVHTRLITTRTMRTTRMKFMYFYTLLILTLMKSYKDLEIYEKAFELAVKIYRLSIQLPSPDKFETGGQIRRSSQTIKDTIVEGYGRRRYKNDFVKYLIYSHSSLLESTSQAEFLNVLHPNSGWSEIISELNILGIKINNFISFVETK